MKKLFFFSILSLSVFSFVGCIKNKDKIFAGSQAEIDATSWNSNAAGLTYPIMTRVPRFDFVTGSTDSTLRRTAGTVRIRINLIGAPTKSAQTVGYQIFSTPITTIAFPATIAGQTPATAAGTLSVLDAVAGTHYAALSGKVTIPADSSFGYISVQVLNPGSTAGQARFLGIRLDSTGSLRPAVNYSQLGLVIDQR